MLYLLFLKIIRLEWFEERVLLQIKINTKHSRPQIVERLALQEQMIHSTINHYQDVQNTLCFRRDYEVVSIRQDRREKRYRQKRIKVFDSNNTQSLTILDAEDFSSLHYIYQQEFTVQKLEQLLTNTCSQDSELRLRSAVGLRKLVTADNALAAKINTQHRLTCLLNLIKAEQKRQIILEALCCLAKITCENIVDQNLFIQSGGADALLNLLKSTQKINVDILQHAIVTIGNIVHQSAKLKKYFIKNDCLDLLMKVLQNNLYLPAETLQQTCWTLSEFCRSSPEVEYKSVSEVVKYICCVLVQGNQNISDPFILRSCVDCLSQQISIKNNNLWEMSQTGLIECLLSLCRQDCSQNDLRGFLYLLGNFSTGQTELMHLMINQGLLEVLMTGLQKKNKRIKRDVCWILSNVAACDQQTTKALVAHPSLISIICRMFNTEDVKIRKQICFFFGNLTAFMSEQAYFELIMQNQIYESFSEILDCRINKVILSSLKCLELILAFLSRKEGNLKIFLRHFSTCKGDQKIQQLQLKDADIYLAASRIIELYFDFQSVWEIQVESDQKEDQMAQSKQTGKRTKQKDSKQQLHVC